MVFGRAKGVLVCVKVFERRQFVWNAVWVVFGRVWKMEIGFKFPLMILVCFRSFIVSCLDARRVFDYV